MSPWPLLCNPKLLSVWKVSSQLPTGLKDPSIKLLTIPPNVFWRKHTQKYSRAVPGSVPRSDPWRGDYRGLPCWPLTTLACKHESVQSERKGEGRAPYYGAHTDLSDTLSLWHGGETKEAPPPPPPCDWAGSLATNTAASWLLPQPGQCQGRFRQGWGEETRSGSTHTGLIQACNYHNSPRVAWVSAPPLGARTSTPRRPQYPSWETVTPGCGWWRRKGWPWEDGGRGAPGALDLGLEVISCLSYKNRCAVKPRQRLKAGLFSRGLK